MAIITILKGGIMERRDIRSGQIYKQGSKPEDAKYGVIYSANKDEKDSDLELNTSDLLDAWIGPVAAPESDKSKFFTILGGYYYKDNRPNEPTITNVFGVAETEFGVTAGGHTDLHDAGWILDDDLKPSLDERLKNTQGGRLHHGWTFIVKLSETAKYPETEQELKIFKEKEEVPCPELTNLEGIETKKDDKTSTYAFTVKVSGEQKPEEYEWDCGDGTKEKSSEPTMTHNYPLPESESKKYTVSVVGVGPRDCKDSAQTEIIIDPPKPPECPEITSPEGVQTSKDDKTSTFIFKVKVTGENQPEKYEWDSGDGPSKTSTEPTMSHTYPVPSSGSKTYIINVKAVGPGDCEDNKKTQITITAPDTPPPPPPPPTNGGPPKICTYLPLIVAFFMALTFCTILVSWVVDLSEQAEESGWLVPMIFVFGVLTAVSIFFWFKKGCPKGKKQWMGIFSVVFLTGFLVGWYMLRCLPGWFWVINILDLGLAGFCVFMYKKCGATAMEFILAAVVCFLAFCVAGFLIAYNALPFCCGF